MASFPQVGYEAVGWDVHPATLMSRKDRAWVGRPYQAAVPAMIAHASMPLPSDVLAAAEDATTEVARFDAEMGAEIAPFGAILLRSESASSSQIENLSASARAIAEAEVTGHGRPNADVIVGNVRAMRAALALSERLDGNAILDMHRALMERSDPVIVGHWRDDQVWVGAGATPHTAQFVPPVPSRVRAAMDDLVAFVAREDLPVLSHVAVAHAQFETIHPFPDGNGRTGRALVHAMLRAKGVTRAITVPISGGLLEERDGYFDALTAYRAGDLEPLVRAVTAATFQAVQQGRKLVGNVRGVRAAWAAALTGVRSDSAAHRLADGLLSRPVVSAREVAEILGMPHNVNRHIRALVDHGILIPHQDYKSRNMTWRAQDVLDVLDGYATSVGRRPEN